MVRGQRVALLLEGLVPRHQPDAEFRCVNDGLETNTVYFFAFNPTASNLAFTVCSSGVQNIIRYFLATHYSTSSHNFFRVRKNSKLWGDRQVMG